MKPGKWYPLERHEDFDDEISYRWPLKTERMWELRLRKRMDAGIREYFQHSHCSLVYVDPTPAVHLFFPQDYDFSGHLVWIRKAWANLPMASYENWRSGTAKTKAPAYCGTGFAVVPSKYVLRKLAEESPLFAPIWEDLKGLSSDASGIYLADAPDAAWLESIQPNERRLFAAFRDTRNLDKVGLKMDSPGDAARAQFRRALGLSEAGETAAVQKLLEDLLERHPEYWRVWGELTSCLILQGKPRRAYDVVRRIQRRYPDALLLDRIAVRCCLQTREWCLAERHIKRLWGLNPWDHALLLQYALVAFHLHDYRLSVQLYENSAEHESLYACNRRPYAIALGKVGRCQEGLDLLLELVDEDEPDPDLLIHIGWLLTRLGRPREGLAYCRRALDLTGESSSAWDRLGFAHLGMGNHGEATAAFLKAIHLHPESPEAWRHLLHAYHRGGQSDKLAGAMVFAQQVLPGELARFEKEKGTELAD